MGAVFDQDIDPDKQVFMGDGRLVDDDLVLLQQGAGLAQGLIVAQGADVMATGEVEFGQLTHLKAALSQGQEKGIIQFLISVLVLLARVVKLGRAFRGQLEAGFGQVAGDEGTSLTGRFNALCICRTST